MKAQMTPTLFKTLGNLIPCSRGRIASVWTYWPSSDSGVRGNRARFPEIVVPSPQSCQFLLISAEYILQAMNCLLLYAIKPREAGYKARTYLGATLIKDYLDIEDFAELLQRQEDRDLFLTGPFPYLYFSCPVTCKRGGPYLGHRWEHKISVMNSRSTPMLSLGPSNTCHQNRSFLINIFLPHTI